MLRPQTVIPIRTSRRRVRVRVTRRSRLARAAHLAVALLFLAQQSAWAAVITVDRFDSTVADDGDCSLREAITAANTDTASGAMPGECPAGSGADTVELTGSATLTVADNFFNGPNGLPLVSSDITLEGNGNTIARDGGAPAFRIFRVFSSLTLNDVTVSNGQTPYDGGGILNSGTTTLTNSTLSGNSAASYGGGIQNVVGTVTLTDSTLSGNSADFGGGLMNIDATATLTNSTVSGNMASSDGGGLFNWNQTTTTTLTIGSSTVSGNSASAFGGGISNFGATLTLTDSTLSGNTAAANNGGGLSNTGTATLTNNTVSGNSAAVFGGGLSNFGGTLTLTHTTLSGNSAVNGGGLLNTGAATLTNSLVANSTGNNCVGVVTDGGNNLVDDATCGAIPGTLTGLDPTLADNGGPTETHALLVGSNAIDAAGACGLATDQRGAARPAGACDSGAFEWLPPILVSGGCTLVDAITSANTDMATGGCPAGLGPDTIELTGDVTLALVVDTTDGGNGLPSVESDITVKGGGYTIARDGGAPDFRIFHVDASGTLALDDLTVSNGAVYPDGGGGLLNRGTATLTDTTLSGNSGGVGGGLQNNTNSTATLISTTLSGNSAVRGGGFFNSSSGTLTLTDTTLSGNSTTSGRGGGGDNLGTATLTNTTLSANSAVTEGGGLWNFGAATLTDTTLSGNSAGTSGGGVFSSAGTLTLTSTTLSGNSAGTSGGGLFSTVGTPTLTNTTLSGNSAASGGGVATGFLGDVILVNSLVANSTNGNCAGVNPVTDGGNNLADDATCATIPSTLTGLDPTLANNGGPTLTHALLAGSNAIDAAGSCGLSTDQRGAPRPASPCDSGAFEVQTPSCGSSFVDHGEQCDDGNTSDGDCCSASCQFQPALGVGGMPNCCSAGVCQTGVGCGAICFTPGAICEQPGGAGTACTCELP